MYNQINSLSRDERQDLGVTKAIKTATETGVICATLNWATGVGKTHGAIKVINRVEAKQGDFKRTVVVPTSNLVKQWYKRVDNNPSYEVITIQGLLSRNEQIETHFLVIDEIHKFAADEFSKIFKLIKYKHILGLTATFKRLDGKHDLISLFCPVIDIITLEEARRNGWVADFMEYCWGIEFNKEDKETYRILNERVEELMPYFNGDWNVVIGCCSKKDRNINGKYYRGSNSFIEDNPKIELFIYENEVERRLIDKSEKVEALTQKANVCRTTIMQRKEYTDKALCKIDAALEIINTFNMKTVTFGTSTEVADKITDRLGSIARSYHTKIDSRVMTVPNKKGKMVSRKVGKDKILEYDLEDFENDVFRVLNTAKKADLGLDIKGLRLGINIARTSDPGVNDQKKGRLVRDEMITVDDELVIKEAIFIQLYVKGTKEESTLKYMLKDSQRVRWIQSLDEIKI